MTLLRLILFTILVTFLGKQQVYMRIIRGICTWNFCVKLIA